MKKSLVSMGLVTTLVGTLLVGCSADKGAEVAASPKASEAAAASASAKPDDKSPIKITWFVDQESYKKNCIQLTTYWIRKLQRIREFPLNLLQVMMIN